MPFPKNSYPTYSVIYIQEKLKGGISIIQNALMKYGHSSFYFSILEYYKSPCVIN